MKPISLEEGIVIALLASLFGSITFFALAISFRDELAMRLVIIVLAFGYTAYLLGRSQERKGRIGVMLLWCVLALTVSLFKPPLVLFLVLHVLAIWLIRSLYAYASLLPVLADLGLCLFSVTAAILACHQSGSVFLSIWCFFLVQAFFVAMPAGKMPAHKNNATEANLDDEFNRAYQAAEEAIRKLSSLH